MGILSYFVVLSTQTHYKNQVICLIKYKNVFAKTFSECGENYKPKSNVLQIIYIKKYKIDLKNKNVKIPNKQKFHVALHILFPP